MNTMQHALFENLGLLFKQRTELVASIGELSIQRAENPLEDLTGPDRILAVLLMEYNEIMLEIDALLKKTELSS